MKPLIGAALCLALAAPAFGQGMDFQQLLSGKEIPTAVQLKELNSDWRHLSIGTTEAGKGGMSDLLGPLMQAGMMSDKGQNKNDAAAAMLGISVISALFGGGESQKPVYYTQGRTVTVGGETFLLAYRYQKPPLNLMQFAAAADKAGKDAGPTHASAGALNPESSLTLSLINLKTITTLGDIRPFDMAQEIAESANAGGGLLDMIMQQAGQEAAQSKQKPAPAKAGAKPRKPAARVRPRP